MYTLSTSHQGRCTRTQTELQTAGPTHREADRLVLVRLTHAEPATQQHTGPQSHEMHK